MVVYNDKQKEFINKIVIKTLKRYPNSTPYFLEKKIRKRGLNITDKYIKDIIEKLVKRGYIEKQIFNFGKRKYYTYKIIKDISHLNYKF